MYAIWFLLSMALISAYLYCWCSMSTAGNFITTDGFAFKIGQRNFFLFSANYWQAVHLAGYNKTELFKDLDDLSRNGINNIRIMAGSEGPDDQPFRITPSMQKAPSSYNPRLLQGSIRWSGGFGQYVQWSTNEKIPYPSSWNRTAGEWTDSPLDPFMDYTRRFYRDEMAQHWYIQNVRKILQRRNTITGQLYSKDPNIFSYELANEPQDAPISWVSQASKFIKSIDRNHLVTIGLESRYDQQEFSSLFNIPTIDYTTLHIWAQNRGIYNMSDPSELNISNAIDWATGWVEKVNGWNSDLSVKKPCVLEEFGFPRDNWERPMDKYSPLNSISRRNRYFEAVAKSAKSFKLGGLGFWNYAGRSRPGDRIVGDPPHEPPGWYSIYDSDDTIAILRKVLQL